MKEAHLIIEPSNTYHLPLVRALAGVTVAYTLINPAQTAAFARAQGKRAKRDPEDAQVLTLAKGGQHPRPVRRPRGPRSGSRPWKGIWSGSSENCGPPGTARIRPKSLPGPLKPVLDSLDCTIDQLNQEIDTTKEAINHQLEIPHHCRKQMELLTSIPGIGRRTASLLPSEMPPVHRCTSAKSWVAFCGLAPEPRLSGKGSYSRLSRMESARV